MHSSIFGQATSFPLVGPEVIGKMSLMHFGKHLFMMPCPFLLPLPVMFDVRKNFFLNAHIPRLYVVPPPKCCSNFLIKLYTEHNNQFCEHTFSLVNNRVLVKYMYLQTICVLSGTSHAVSVIQHCHLCLP